MMFNRSEFIAESGAKPHDLGFYADWIPLMLGAGFVFGLLLGLVFACLMMLISKLQKTSETKASFLATYGTRLACGAVAGGVIGWPLMRDSGALIFVGLGLCSAAVSMVMSRRRPKKVETAKGGS